ncbi:MAG: bis-aminopropyl spermidine synthase family protein [Nocardioides sp.]
MTSAEYAVLGDVAAAVDLNEGEAGVLRVLRALTVGDRQPTNVVARAARLPVPLAAAVLGELRSRGLVDDRRPAGLTDLGRSAATALELRPVELPADGLADLVAELEGSLGQTLEADLALDQSFATAATKVRRVLDMIAVGALPTPSLLAVGDDDLISVTVARVQQRLGVRLVGELVVVDVAKPILDEIRHELGGADVDLQLVEHDLRQPLPDQLRGRATVAMTDPPYTTQGARLFLSRALEGLRPGPGWDLFLHYGHKPPGPALDLQRVLGELSLVVRELRPGANRYHGAGVIGGASDAWRLEVATAARAEVSAYDGPMYTADLRNRPRHYVCAGCGLLELVGPGQAWPMIGELKKQGCPSCGGTTFAPGQLA